MSIELYKGRVALVTGASSGNGAAICRQLQENGLIVVGVARRIERVEALRVPEFPGKLYSFKCDVSKEEDIINTFKWIRENLGGVDVLINNAGILSDDTLTDAETSEWTEVLDTNVFGYSICIREAVKDMKARGVDDGYIINICSVAIYTPLLASTVAMYFASKYAINMMTEGLRRELGTMNSKIRISQISPGAINTEITDGRKSYDPGFLASIVTLEAADIAEAVVFILSQHPRVQIHDIIMNPTRTELY